MTSAVRLRYLGTSDRFIVGVDDDGREVVADAGGNPVSVTAEQARRLLALPWDSFEVVDGDVHLEPEPETCDVQQTAGLPAALGGRYIATYPSDRLRLGQVAVGADDLDSAHVHFAQNSGQPWVVKHYFGDEDRVASELVANAVYRVMGARVPEAGIVQVNGRAAVGYPLLAGEPRDDFPPSEELGRHYMTDALLANYDVMGNNILWDADGRPLRIDQGSNLLYRARGQRKRVALDEVPEIETMLTIGQAAGRVALTPDDAVDQGIEIAARLTDDAIDGIVDEAPFATTAARELTRRALKGRVGFIRDDVAGAF